MEGDQEVYAAPREQVGVEAEGRQVSGPPAEPDESVRGGVLDAQRLQAQTGVERVHGPDDVALVVSELARQPHELRGQVGGRGGRRQPAVQRPPLVLQLELAAAQRTGAAGAGQGHHLSCQRRQRSRSPSRRIS